ncbi:4'-phosphopantetheinyl transferase superfamily protein [Denitratimonas sp. CY0512]|uniref:4'-phosphopantetheinyl transferase family protein n=1 Tax=Denitratimonas sp. CY0512 TaxID=3131940 RepID=UPI0030B72488
MSNIAFSSSSISGLLASVPDGQAWLGEDERQRVSGLAHPGRRTQYLVGHWLARQLLAAAEGGDPFAWSLRRTESGAPMAFRGGRRSGLHVSLSHTADCVACAVSGHAVGIDIEQPRRERDYLALADSLYDAGFQADLRACDEVQRRSVFFRRWTLDEARAKASGEGLKMHALRSHAWVSAAENQAAGWTWDLADGWLALAMAEGTDAVPLRFDIQGEAAGLAPRHWRVQPLTP